MPCFATFRPEFEYSTAIFEINTLELSKDKLPRYGKNIYLEPNMPHLRIFGLQVSYLKSTSSNLPKCKISGKTEYL